MGSRPDLYVKTYSLLIVYLAPAYYFIDDTFVISLSGILNGMNGADLYKLAVVLAPQRGDYT